MTDLVVRRLMIDLDAPLPARWCGGDAFRTAFFDALSMSFPVGEQYFIDSVRNAWRTLPEGQRARFADAVQGFVGQEATHRRVHAAFNAHLARRGLVNHIERRALRRIRANAHRDARVHLAATAATEHFTAVFAGWLMRHPEVLDGVEPRLRLLWTWHAAEESEHRAVAFDLYQACSGDHRWRLRLYRWVTVVFLTDLLAQTVSNLWRDRSLLRPSTWRSGWRLLFARDSLLRGNWRQWRAYLSPDFHPSQSDGADAARWLREHADVARPVGRAAS